MHTLNVYASAYTSAVERGETKTAADASAWETVRAYRVNEIRRSVERGPIDVCYFAANGIIVSS